MNSLAQTKEKKYSKKILKVIRTRMSESSSSRSSQVNISVQPNYDIMSLKTFNNANIQKAMSVASDAQHSLANFMDAPTIDTLELALLNRSQKYWPSYLK